MHFGKNHRDSSMGFSRCAVLAGDIRIVQGISLSFIQRVFLALWCSHATRVTKEAPSEQCCKPPIYPLNVQKLMVSYSSPHRDATQKTHEDSANVLN